MADPLTPVARWGEARDVRNLIMLKFRAGQYILLIETVPLQWDAMTQFESM